MADRIIMTIIVNAAVFSFLFLALLLVRKTAGKNISPVLMLILWSVLVVKLIIPFGFESEIGILPGAAAIKPGSGFYGTGNVSEIYAQPESSEIYDDSCINISQPHEAENAVADIPSLPGAADTAAADADWTAIAFAVWALGAAFTICALWLSSANLRRRIRHARIHTAAHILKILNDCRLSLGIRREISVMAQSAVDKPFITGLFKPLLVLPENTSLLDERALRHIFLHELTHYKRGDLWIIKLMNILRSLYWFNPLVWSCFKLVRADMETACDLSVIKTIGYENKLSYIETLLSFAVQKQSGSRLAAVLGLLDGRKAMEKRIKGMYGKEKTGAAGRAIAVLSALLMLAICILTACRASVSEPLEYTPVPAAQYEASEHWSETITEGKITLEIDADILRPETSVFPIVKVEPQVFTQQRVDELVSYFAYGRKLYKPQGRTKADYAKEIDMLLTPIWSNGRLVVTAQNEFQAHELEWLKADAPESYPKEYIDSTLTYDIDWETLKEKKESGKNYLHVMVDSGNGSDPKILLSNIVKGYNSGTSFWYSARQSYNYRTEEYYNQLVQWIEDDENDITAGDARKNYHIDEWPGLFDKVAISQEQALAQAEEVIGDLGIEDMMLMSMSRAASREYPDSGGWRLEYGRQSGGVPVYRNFTRAADQDAEPPQHYVPFSEERLEILVTKNGILNFYWHGCAHAMETVSKDPELMKLDEIKRILKDRIIGTKTFDNFETEQKTVKVKAARLCMGYISSDDGKAQIVPVWVFELEERYFINKLKPRVYENVYVINAIDGGVIQRLQENIG